MCQAYHASYEGLLDMTLCEYFELMPIAVNEAEAVRKRLARRR